MAGSTREVRFECDGERGVVWTTHVVSCASHDLIWKIIRVFGATGFVLYLRIAFFLVYAGLVRA